MPVKDLIKKLNDFIKINPDYADYQIVCATWNERGDFETVEFDSPKIGKDEFGDTVVLI